MVSVLLKCEICPNTYKVKPFLAYVRPKRFCSLNCKNDWMSKSHTPWNKGLSKETHPQLSNSGVLTGHIPWNKGKTVLEITGENHPRWIIDRTQLAKLKNGNEYRNSPLHKEWSRNVKNRDDWKCRVANQNCSGRMEAHHILSWSDHLELRYEVNNGITLCHAHHPRARAEEVRLAPEFQELVSSKG